MANFSKKGLRAEIIREGKVLGLHAGFAEMIAERTTEKVAKWAERRSVITTSDLNKKVSEELQKYNKDLAYVYENRGKII